MTAPFATPPHSNGWAPPSALEISLSRTFEVAPTEAGGAGHRWSDERVQFSSFRQHATDAWAYSCPSYCGNRMANIQIRRPAPLWAPLLSSPEVADCQIIETAVAGEPSAA